jgi:hypothetical protein
LKRENLASVEGKDHVASAMGGVSRSEKLVEVLDREGVINVF